jgi:hypothetical protein
MTIDSDELVRALQENLGVSTDREILCGPMRAFTVGFHEKP